MTGTPARPDSNATRRRAIVVTVIVAAVIAAGIVIVSVLLIPTAGVNRTAPTPSASSSGSGTARPSPTPSSSASAGATTPPSSKPVPIASPATVTPGLTARIGALEAVQGEAQGPGQVAGPSIRFTVSVTNSGSSAADLSSAVVTAYSGADRTPASQLDKPGGADLPTSVAAGATATGTYIFKIPDSDRDDVQIEFDYAVGVAPVTFRGSAPR